MMGAKKTAMEPDAPWSDKCKKPRPASERKWAVVYVLADESSEWCKVGFTTALKTRLSALSYQSGARLHICFWAEFLRGDALRIESRAKRILRTFAPQHKGEWFRASSASVSGAVCLAAEALQIDMRRTAGFPGAKDPDMNEVEEILAEPLIVNGDKGRLPREEWAPQKRSISS